jgi:hypothetical protein
MSDHCSMFGSVNLLFDKSAFESLTHEEHLTALRYFRPNVTPVLVNEIVADLAKEYKGQRPPDERVAILASKFFGSGEPVSLAHRYIIQGDLFGNAVPMTGRIIPENAIEHEDNTGEVSVFVDLAEANFTIMRLATNVANDADRRFARAWRERAATLSFDKFSRLIAAHPHRSREGQHTDRPRTKCRQGVGHIRPSACLAAMVAKPHSGLSQSKLNTGSMASVGDYVSEWGHR